MVHPIQLRIAAFRGHSANTSIGTVGDSREPGGTAVSRRDLWGDSLARTVAEYDTPPSLLSRARNQPGERPATSDDAEFCTEALLASRHVEEVLIDYIQWSANDTSRQLDLARSPSTRFAPTRSPRFWSQALLERSAVIDGAGPVLLAGRSQRLRMAAFLH